MSLRDINMTEIGRSIQLVGAVYGDSSDEAFVVLVPGADPVKVASLKNVTLTLDEWQEFLRQTDLVEVEALVRDPDTGKVAKAIVRKSSRQVAKTTSWVVFRRDGFRCRYCGTEDVPMTVDHLVTWESGGPSIEENLVTSCSRCNNARGETPFEDWLVSGYYKRVSAKLGYAEKFANQGLIPTLEDIPRTPLKPGKKRKRR